jgi:methionine-gamma-lyase
VRFYGLKDMTGAVLSAQDAFLVLRGLKTLALRMDRHCAQRAGVWPNSSSPIQRFPWCIFPGLPGFPQFELARRQMAQPGGMIAFELKDGIEAGRRFHERAAGCSPRAVSLGDAESLAQHPGQHDALLLHAGRARRAPDRAKGWVRLSIGLEDLPDLLADLEQALRAA